ncbi:hypothetical protein L9F63_012274, partial [Diploptera punctata]
AYLHIPENIDRSSAAIPHDHLISFTVELIHKKKIVGKFKKETDEKYEYMTLSVLNHAAEGRDRNATLFLQERTYCT